MSNIDRILGENDVRKQLSPRKQFEAAKEAMDDQHCDDVDSNRELRKKLKLSKQMYYSAIKAMRDGREVGANGRPTYLHDSEKVDFWNWVKTEIHAGHRPTMNEMEKYVTHILMRKRPTLIRKRKTVSRQYIKSLLEEGGISLDSRVKRPGKVVSKEEVKTFFQSVHETVQKNGIDKDMVFSMREMSTSLDEGEKPSTRGVKCTLIACVSASGLRLPSVYVIPPQKDLDSLSIRCCIPPSCLVQSEKGEVTSTSILVWIRDQLIPWIDERRRYFGWKDALLVVGEIGNKFDETATRLLESHQIHLVCIPLNAAFLLQPLDNGIYGSYQYSLKLNWVSSDVADVLQASETAVSDAFTKESVLDAWDETTMMSEKHYSVWRLLREENK